MPRPYDWQTFVSSWKVPAMSMALGAVLAILFSLAIPFKYASTVRVLIIQANAAALDPYTSMKATERIASNMAELVYTSNFFTNALAQARGFDATYFPPAEYAKRKIWRKAVAMSVAPGSGIMSITAYHPERGQARFLADAVARELAAEVPAFFGANVRVQIIDSPLDSRWIAQPNFVANALFGLVVGGLAGLAWVLARMGEKKIFS